MADADRWRAAALLLLWEHTLDVVSIIGDDGDGNLVLLDINDQGLVNTGWSRDQLVGVPMRDLLPAEEADEQDAQLRSVFERGQPVSYEVQREVPTGRRTYDYTLYPLLDDDGAVVRAVAISRDRTDQRQAETALEETQLVARIGHWSWDVVNDVTTWSTGMFRLFGRDPDDFEPSLQAVLDALTTTDAERLSALVAATLERGEGFTFEHDIELPTGEVRHAEARAELVRDADGNPMRLAGTTQDVTDAKRAERHERELEEARTRQEQAVELNDDVLQGLSVASLALELGDSAAASAAVDRTIGAVRTIISGLLTHRSGGSPLEPGDLVREHAAGGSS